MRIAPGVPINDRYALDERIASGSMGEVWRATDRVLKRTVAVKILHPERIEDEGFRSRFRAEARHAARLSHPGVAEVHDYGEHDDLAYLVMEYLPGQSLDTILARPQPLSAEATLEIVSQVARALQAAHDIGLVHRDIKPANLIVGPNGEVKITDFGTARAVDASTVTEPGVVVGTAQYLAPEQAEGGPPTPSADTYALGVVAYACLTGDPPFTGASPVEIAEAHVQEAPQPLPQTVPGEVRTLVAACLAKSPSERPASAAEVARKCDAAWPAAQPSARRAPRPTLWATGRPAGSARAPRRRPAGIAVAGAAVAVVAIMLFGSTDGLFPLTPMMEAERVDNPVMPEPAPGPKRQQVKGAAPERQESVSMQGQPAARSDRAAGGRDAAPRLGTSALSTSPARPGGSGSPAVPVTSLVPSSVSAHLGSSQAVPSSTEEISSSPPGPSATATGSFVEPEPSGSR